ncbi:MAG: glycerophosphodiester phosphodiesterase family protein [bacterium]|nr:glycerophosphodiester phosphodiesterase family protein [bacterium]
MNNILKIGHRGACGYEPENTLISFQKAIELNVDMVELDVHLSINNDIIVMHDETVNRTTNGTGYVKQQTLSELRQLSAGKGEKIPTLEQTLNLINKRVKLNIELKGLNTAKPTTELIMKYVKQNNWKYQDFLVSSFNANELLEFFKILPQINIGVIYNKVPNDYIKLAQKLNAYSINLSQEFITQKLIDDIHNHGLKVLVYTVNHNEDIKKIKSMGIDGIFSDYPDRL